MNLQAFLRILYAEKVAIDNRKLQKVPQITIYDAFNAKFRVTRVSSEQNTIHMQIERI